MTEGSLVATSEKPWEEMFNRIRVVRRIDWIYPSKPTVAELDSVEAELGFRFPLSYRVFAEQFGLNGEIHILPEMLRLRTVEGTSGSVVSATREYQKNPEGWWWFKNGVPDRLKRMITFAQDGHYEKFLFDPAEVTIPAFREVRIYAIDSAGDIRPVGDTFSEFLTYLHDRYRYDPAEEYEPGTYEDKLLPWKVFKPDSLHSDPIIYTPNPIREKMIPEPDVLQQHLTNTVCDLARSIRDGHHEAFPVLADALEEAGCTNADLLDSCRKGDPDIDGVWVLRVLLGEK